ncbi:hypothetical protein [Thermococcus sp. Bubb.Bath]|uniref:hypothetical protein n=1 Tax=Thermococcus sp. Bubb.Bath TaxID=1638242 RepID=UPI0014398211|nr:hypothetical protein [Thermococcus sp. Bubb.Bath]NJF24095.1 hypothetical protein [Thermococcus sp. Bubb.Bath]
MRALNQRRLLVLSQAILLILVSFGLALPSINMDVQEIGEGLQRLVSPVLQGSIWFYTNLP